MNGNQAKRNWLDYVAPVILLIIIILGMQWVLTAYNVPRWIIAKPFNIFEALVKSFFSDVLPNFLITFQEIILGYIIAVPVGVIIAILLTQFRVLEKAFSPYTIVVIATPLLILVPLLMMYFGIGLHTRVIAVVLQSFSIVMMNASTGFNTVDPLKLELMKSIGATRWQKLKYVIIPSSLPNIFNGMRMSGIAASTAALATEFVGSRNGLGAKIVYASNYIQTELMFAYIIMVAIIGIALFLLPSLIEKVVIRWRI